MDLGNFEKVGRCTGICMHIAMVFFKSSYFLQNPARDLSADFNITEQADIIFSLKTIAQGL